MPPSILIVVTVPRSLEVPENVAPVATIFPNSASAIAEKEIFPVLVPMAVVNPATKRSDDSSQPQNTLLPVLPRSASMPKSLALLVAPALTSIRGSLTLRLTASFVTVVPLTVRLPVMVRSPPMVALSVRVKEST